jgi:transcriptional regulator with XRE-family HTH domain
MTGNEFKERLAAIGWKQADFARSTGITPASVSGWANDNPIPEWVDSYLRMAETLRTIIKTFRADPRLVALDVADREIFESAKGR